MKISIKPSFAGYILLLCGLSGPIACIGLTAALIIHELGHALIAILIREPIERIEIAPFGGVMLYRPGCTPSKGVKGLALALAGPLANYVGILLIGAVARDAHSSVYRSILLANLSMLFINCIPALPLDGGSALFCIGYYLFDVSKLIHALCIHGMILGVSFCILACIGVIWYETLNLSFVIVGLYIFLYAKRCKSDMLAQNIYTVIHERIMKPQAAEKVAIFRLTGNEQLYGLVEFFCKGSAPVFMIEQTDGSTIWISGTAVCRAMIDDPCLSMGGLIEKLSKNKRKSE